MRQLFVLLSVLLVTAAPVLAGDMDYGRVDLLPGWEKADGTRVAAIRMRLNPGWKTYWRVPGAAGIPPSFDWTGSENLARAEVLYPSPELMDTGGIISLGYHGDVVFPVMIRADAGDLRVTLTLTFAFGVCAEICIPEEVRLHLDLGAGMAEDNRPLIESALARLPQSGAEAGVVSADCSLEPDGQDFVLSATVDMGVSGQRPALAVFEPGQPDVWADVATASLAGTTLTANAPLMNFGKRALVLERSKIRLTLIGGGRAIDILGCPAT